MSAGGLRTRLARALHQRAEEKEGLKTGVATEWDEVFPDVRRYWLDQADTLVSVLRELDPACRDDLLAAMGAEACGAFETEVADDGLISLVTRTEPLYRFPVAVKENDGG